MCTGTNQVKKVCVHGFENVTGGGKKNERVTSVYNENSVLPVPTRCSKTLEIPCTPKRIISPSPEKVSNPSGR